MTVALYDETGGRPNTLDVRGDGEFFDVVSPRAFLRRRAPGVYQVHAPTGADITAILDEATATYTLAQWLSDADRRDRWDGTGAEDTIAGEDHGGELVREAGAANPDLITTEDEGALVVDDAGAPLEIE